MKLFSRLAVTAAVTALAAGGGVTVASAYSISGGTYTGTATGPPTITVGGGAYTMSCSTTTFSGSATGTDTMTMSPAIGGCTIFGFPFFVTQSGAWTVRVAGNAGTTFTGGLEIPVGVTTTTTAPIAGCTIEIAGPQSFQHGVGGNVLSMTNYAGGVNLSALASGIAYTATGCPFSSGTDGTYDTNGNVTIPGITVS